MKRRLQALSALSTHLVYPCVQSTNIACSLYNCIMFKTKSTSTKLKKSAPLAPFIWHFYVQLLRVTLSKKYPIYFLPSPFLRTVQIFTITRQLALRSTSIFPCPPSFFRYKFLPEHIKYFPCPPSHFPTYKFLPEQIKYLPCPPSIFPAYKFYTRTDQVFALFSKYFSYVQILPDHVKYFLLSSKYVPLSSKSFFCVQMRTGTDPVFALSSKSLF